MVGEKVTKNAFNYYMEQKVNSKNKMKNVVYKELKIQAYLSHSNFILKEKQLLFALRSYSYKAKTNFNKLNRSNLNCSLCNSEETQIHIFSVL